jgi:hypothetical protein
MKIFSKGILAMAKREKLPESIIEITSIRIKSFYLVASFLRDSLDAKKKQKEKDIKIVYFMRILSLEIYTIKKK